MKFKYNDKVIIKKGFYKGRTGVVNDYKEKRFLYKGNELFYKVDLGFECIWFTKKYLNKVLGNKK